MHRSHTSTEIGRMFCRSRTQFHEGTGSSGDGGEGLRRARFSFALCGIEPGKVVEFWYTYRKPSGILCPVLDDCHVEYEGKVWSLSGLARRLTEAERVLSGPSYFKYEGEWLNDLRDRLGR